MAVIKQSLKTINKKLDKLLTAPQKKAETFFMEALNCLEHNNFADAYKNFDRVVDNATEGFVNAMKDDYRIDCTQLLIIATVMTKSW